MSKTLQKYVDAHPEQVESWHNENHNARGLDYWVYMKPGWYCARTDCGTVHEDTVKETIAALRGASYDIERWRRENQR